MAQLILSKSGRCVGGDQLMRVDLEQFRSSSQGRYKITVSLGTHTKTSKIMLLHLVDVTLSQAKSKFYDVWKPISELIELTEDVEDE